MDARGGRRLVGMLGLAVAFMAVVTIWGLLGPRGSLPPPLSHSPGPASPQPEGAAVLIAAGDIAGCDRIEDELTARLVDAFAGTVAALGDLAYEQGTVAQFRDCYDPTWGRFVDRTRPVPGNHEYGTPQAAGYFGYFGPIAGTPPTSWYAYDLGAWRIYALDSNCHLVGGCGQGSPQGTWRAADLFAHPGECVLAYWHHPRFSSSRHGSQLQTQPLWEAMADAGADVILQAHDHAYERFAPLDRAGDPDGAAGMRSFVVGTGGRDLYEFPRILPGSEVREAVTHGILVVSLRNGGYEWRFVPVAGETFTDSGSGTCH